MFSNFFSTSKVELIGVYPIHVTRRSITDAVLYHMYDWMIDEMGNYGLPIDWNMFENLVLVELQWTGKLSKESLKNIHHKFEVPYMPFFISADGKSYLNQESAMQAGESRICFFIHKFDITEPIVIGKKTIKVNTLSELPLRIKPFTHYVPVEDDDEEDE